ncbi:hypothetical protein LAZ67_22000997 [Cordylochernes scorpioides]|uniref:HTH CENPB-type domain-containing protein n=1 Tax=Cordylochernes scorpioides TaxID=51811 RepID=A0ABY6LNP7_9ARAC|nr:hypothetical protein LAZ67_22000997 [Cordylochernes scorpioides]
MYIIMNTCTAAVTGQALRNLFAVHGLPDQIVSNNGRMFIGHEFQEITRKNGIRHITSAPYHPQTNGQAERVAKILKQLLRKNGFENITTVLARALFAMRTTPHGSTGVTPTELLMGRRLTNRMDRLHPEKNSDEASEEKNPPNKFKSPDQVYLRNYSGIGKWTPGTIKTALGPRNYEVITEDGTTAKRHQEQLIRRLSKGEVEETVEGFDKEKEDHPEKGKEETFPTRPIRSRRPPERLYIGYRKLCSKWVTKLLTREMMQTQKEICLDLIESYRVNSEIKRENIHWSNTNSIWGSASFSSFIFITMDRKKVCKKSSAKKKMMNIELKPEIIEKHEQGVRVVDLSRQYGRSTSMICSVLKRKESIKSVTPAKGLTIISKLRTSLHENMEKLLMVWVTENHLQGDTLTQTIIFEKARAIYGDLLKQTPQTSIDEASEESFKASRGWFEIFKKRSGIVRHGEAVMEGSPRHNEYENVPSNEHTVK